MDGLIGKKAVEDVVDKVKRDFVGGSCNALCNAAVRSVCERINYNIMLYDSKEPDTIPVDWIRQQTIQYPGVASQMWDKLLRLWEKEKTRRELGSVK